MAAYSQANSFLGILIFSFAWSIGFHAWTPLHGAMALAYSTGGTEGKAARTTQKPWKSRNVSNNYLVHAYRRSTGI